MNTRHIQLILPEGVGENIGGWLEEDIIDCWMTPLGDGRVKHTIIVEGGLTESVIDKLNNQYRQNKGYRLIVNNLDIILPEIEENESADKLKEAIPDNKPKSRTVSRQELLTDLSYSTRLDINYIVMLLLSVAVAIVGLINNNIAVVIAAMVIAPLLGPNITLALATSVVDYKLAIRAVRVGSIGALIAVVIAILLGLVLPDSTLQNHEILSRTSITYGDFILALAAGAAGTLAFTTGVSGALIGVMVAVALLPPLLVFGLKLGSANLTQAWGAGLLFTINFIGVNLAANLTFYLQGIRPENWWQANESKRNSVAVIAIWTLLFGILLFAVYFSNQN